MPDQEELVSVEKDGRILTGVGVEENDLASTMERHAPGSAMAGEEAPAPASAPSVQKPTRGQKRFDQLTGEREAERRRADAAEQRAKDLEAQLEAAKKPSATPPAPAAPAAPPEPPRPAAASAPPQAAAQPKFPKFDAWFQQHPDKDFDDYLSDLQLHNFTQHGFVRQTDLDAQIRQAIEADRASRTRYEREGQEIARGRTVYPDFDRVVSAPHLMANNWPQYLIDAINAQDEPEHIKYALGKDPALAEQIRTMNPVFAGAALAKLVPSAAVASPASTARTMASPPPAPMQPVGSGGKTATLSSAALAERSSDFDYDKSGYREQRAKERGMTRRK